MLTEKIIRIIANFEKKTGYKVGRIKKRYKFLNKTDLLKAFTFIVFIFLFSGGVTTLFSGAPGIIAQNSMTSQTPTEFFLYSFIHAGYAAGLVLIYSGIRKSKVDMAYISLGIVLLFSLLVVEWYIISVVKGVIV